MTGRSKRCSVLLTVILIFAWSLNAVPVCYTDKVYAESTEDETEDKELIVMNPNRWALMSTANGEDAQTVWYAGNRWKIIGYGNHGNMYANLIIMIFRKE